jgi:hypothetical protein
MRFGSLLRYLRKWQQAGLINKEQVEKISHYMRIERHRQFLKLIRVLFIIGAFWLFVGIIATLRLINIEIFLVIGRLLYNLVSPIIKLGKFLSPKHYREWLSGIACLLGWGLFHRLGIRLRKKSDLRTMQLGYFQEKELRLGTTSFTLGYILASWGLQFFNYAIYPKDPYTYLGKEAIFPLFSLIGTLFFLVIAYLMEDQIALLFGIGFLAHTIGLFTTYFTACYVIGVQFPAIQLIVGLLLVFIGLWHIEKVRSREDNFQFLFGRTYEWTGLLFIYLSLWIMSIWGFTFKEHYWITPRASELWMANILFIAASLFALFYGAVKEDKMFFNFGLTFFIIDSYTLFFSHVWATVGSAVGSLLLGVMLIVTGYILRDLWLKGKIFKKPS